MTPTCVVVGGGITGLAAAWRTSQAGIETILVEASERLGGKLRTIDLDGVQMETGADSFVVRGEGFPSWCHELDLVDELIEPSIFHGSVWFGGRIKPLPRGTMMGLPTAPRTALAAAPLSPLARLRALGDLVMSGPLEGPDISVGAFVRSRFGKQVLERMVDPILAGTRAGRADEMSLAAALPEVDAVARTRRSFMRGHRSGGPVRFLAPRDGMTALVGLIRARLSEVDIRLNTKVDVIARKGADLIVVAGDEVIAASAVIVCLPSHSAATMLAPVAPEAATGLGTIEHASVASVALTFNAPLDLPPTSSGILVPSAEGRTLSAATWWTAKWPHTSSGPGAIRAFVGREARHPALDLGDEDLVAKVLEELTMVLGTLPQVQAHWVARWDRGSPQYRIGHRETVHRIREALKDQPGLRVAGADLEGSGIADCWRQGTDAAGSVQEFLASARR